MLDQTVDQRKEKLLADMAAERGFLPKEWQWVADQDLDFLEAYNNLWRQSSNEGKALPVKTRELIAIAILAFRGSEGAVYSHCKRALKFGATIEELLEAFETMVVTGGAPTLAIGLNALMRILKEQDEAAKK
jgi:4-carboxymuconolactone decarboxylase